MKFDPASNIQHLKQFGEFGGVNPSITDSSTFTFLQADTMEETFLGHTLLTARAKAPLLKSLMPFSRR